jgi:L-galactose dehydrogenase
MEYRPLGRTELEVSTVSLGGAYLMGEDESRQEDNARAVIECALELGINYIDTAPLYGQSEKLLGRVLAGLEGKFHVSTKVGFDPQGFDYRRDSVLESLERSLLRLGIDQLAVAQIHEVNEAGLERILEKGGTLEGLRIAQERGLCRHIGITGRAIPLLSELAATGEFDTLLFYHDYHPCLQLANEQVLPTTATQNMGVVAATVLAGGLYVPGAAQEQALAKLGTAASRARSIIARLGGEGGTLPQTAFRYVLADERISSVSSGAANPEQLREVAQAANMGSLTAETMRYIKEV